MEKLGSPEKVSAVATLLEANLAQVVLSLWQNFQENCLVQMVVAEKPIPHFSWHAAESYAEEDLDVVLSDLVRSLSPFPVQASGIGLFTGPELIVYISLVKTDLLINLQKRIWDRTFGSANNMNQYYHPEHWIPHITLAYDPIDQNALNCILSEVIWQPFNWQIPVDHLAVIHSRSGPDIQAGRKYRFGG